MAVINGTSGADVLKGTLQDQINGRGGNDKITGSGGDDILEGSSGDDTIDGSGGNDLIYGGSGNDVIVDGGGHDQVFAGEGDDTVIGSAGNDKYEAGLGFDTLDFSGSSTSVSVDMHRGVVFGANTGSDTIKDFEKVIGTAGDDTFRGTMGKDTIVTGDGQNTVRGGQGSDDITLGADRDTLVYRSTDVVDGSGASVGVDVVHNFNGGYDRLDFRALFTALNIDEVSENIDKYVHLDDVAGGTMVRVDMTGTGKFVDVALLADLHTGGATASGWASDAGILV